MRRLLDRGDDGRENQAFREQIWKPGIENSEVAGPWDCGRFALYFLLRGCWHALADRSLLAWNGLSPEVGRNASQAHPIGGAILILPGIVTFIFFPTLVKKVTGREVISTPYSEFVGD